MQLPLAACGVCCGLCLQGERFVGCLHGQYPQNTDVARCNIKPLSGPLLSFTSLHVLAVQLCLVRGLLIFWELCLHEVWHHTATHMYYVACLHHKIAATLPQLSLTTLLPSHLPTTVLTFPQAEALSQHSHPGVPAASDAPGRCPRHVHLGARQPVMGCAGPHQQRFHRHTAVCISAGRISRSQAASTPPCTATGCRCCPCSSAG
jgi:hypothetical protein